MFEEAPALMKTIAPCMLMSPITVSQYLKPENGLFDMVIFDEDGEKDTLTLSPDGKYLYGKYDKKRNFKLTRTK